MSFQGDEWIVARIDLLAKGKQLPRVRDRSAAERLCLPDGYEMR